MKKSVFYAKKFIFTVMIFAFILILASCGTENSNETISATESTESITVSDYIPDSGINEQYLSFVKKVPIRTLQLKPCFL